MLFVSFVQLLTLLDFFSGALDFNVGRGTLHLSSTWTAAAYLNSRYLPSHRYH